jgi:hypothetical protein
MDTESNGMFVLLRMLAAWVKLTFWNSKYSIKILTAACTGMSRVRKRLDDKFKVYSPKFSACLFKLTFNSVIVIIIDKAMETIIAPSEVTVLNFSFVLEQCNM